MSSLDGLESNGYSVVSGVLDDATVANLARAADAALARSRSGQAGVRGLVAASLECAALEHDPHIRSLVDPVLGPCAFITRSILFDKRAEANWDVVWHQDKTIAVRERRDVPGFGPWSMKSGTPHVQPPADVLQRVLTVRLHLDDCGPENGPLLVIPRSHSRLLSESELAATDWDRQADVTSLPVPRGGAIVMRPLILHASRKAIVPNRRRVIHLEFAAEPLPGGLEWARC